MPENVSQYQGRVASLRKEISKAGVNGYIIPRTDDFQGEFLAPYAQRLAWLTGFTGSAGSAVVLEDTAVVMSDGRYTLQLREEVGAELYLLADSTEISVGEWLCEHSHEGARIGYDAWLYTPKQIDVIGQQCLDRKIKLVAIEHNLIDAIWFDLPKRPCAPVSLFPDDIAGHSSAEKRELIVQQIKEQDAGACLITASDSICWLLNVRGGDVDYSPLCLSYVLIYDDGALDWFINPAKITGDIIESLGGDVRVFGFEALEGKLKQLDKDKAVWLDRVSAPKWFEVVLSKCGVDALDLGDPCVIPKSIKTIAEQEAIRKAHVADGVAVTKFLKWVDDNHNNIEMDELSVEAKLEQFRAEHPDYLGPSFPTIAGFGANGAIVHYRANEQTKIAIKGNGLLLVDSGGQYRWGTTDITRTMAIGGPTAEMRENYTRVLRGHIAVASAVFSKDTTGKDIDALARKALQEVGLNYAHGTGHGVGCYLGVHEASTQISPREDRCFIPGMVVSNEPGYYKEGEYGIRIESLVLVCEADNEDHYCFETLSFAPFDPKLIVADMLNDQEKLWLANYHKEVVQKLSAHLSKEEVDWLLR